MTNSAASQTNTSPPLLLNAYAKINLTLDVFSKRADGYHDIASVMQTISLSDTLRFTRAERPASASPVTRPTRPTCRPTRPTLSSGRRRRFSMRQRKQGDNLAGGVAIHLVKRIPSQAGSGRRQQRCGGRPARRQRRSRPEIGERATENAGRAVGLRRAVLSDRRNGDGARDAAKNSRPCPMPGALRS